MPWNESPLTLPFRNVSSWPFAYISDLLCVSTVEASCRTGYELAGVAAGAALGGGIMRHSPSYDYVYSPLLYWLGTTVYQRVRGIGVVGQLQG